MPVVLASGSPRRRALVASLGIDPLVRAPRVDETPCPGEDAAAYVRRLAAAKAAAVTAGDDELVIAADTTVVVDGELLLKPADAADAARMLRRLSGRTHDVLTGVALRHGPRVAVEVVRTAVTFVPLGEDDIAWYVGTGEPFDKAGGYALQGAGAVLVERVDGSVSNVVGLPLATVVAMARRLGFELLAPRAAPGP